MNIFGHLELSCIPYVRCCKASDHNLLTYNTNPQLCFIVAGVSLQMTLQQWNAEWIGFLREPCQQDLLT